jgi:DNA-binding MarR family transcriptional regulator
MHNTGSSRVSPRSLDRLDDAVVRLVRARLDRRIHEEVRAASGSALEPAQLYLVRTLAAAGSIRLGALAELCSLDQSTISRQLQTLEAQGLIARTPDPRDRRAQTVQLNSRGRQLSRRLATARRRVLGHALAEWSDSDLEEVAALIERLAATLTTWTEQE